MIFFPLLHFLLEPVLQALVVDETDGAVAFARVKQGVGCALFVAPAHFALDVGLRRVDNTAVDFDGLLGEVVPAEPIVAFLINLGFLDG